MRSCRRLPPWIGIRAAVVSAFMWINRCMRSWRHRIGCVSDRGAGRGRRVELCSRRAPGQLCSRLLTKPSKSLLRRCLRNHFRRFSSDDLPPRRASISSSREPGSASLSPGPDQLVTQSTSQMQQRSGSGVVYPHAYVHVPFCARRCSYCDFSIAIRKDVPADHFVDAIMAEMVTRGIGLGAAELETVYVGGGTPSKLGGAGLARLIFEIAHLAGVDNFSTSGCLLYTSPSPRDRTRSRMPSSA